MPFLDKYHSDPLYTDRQRELAEGLTNQVLNAFGTSAPVYGGQISPDANATQQNAFNSARGFLGSDPSGMVNYQQPLMAAMSGNPAYQIDPAARDQYFSNAIEAPARAAYQDSMQELDHRYGARFGRAGSQLEAGLRNAGRFNTELSAQRADMHWQDELMRRQSLENAANRQLGGVGTAVNANSQLQGNRLNNLGGMLAAGAAERGIEGQRMAEDYGQWQSAQAYNNPWLGFLGAALTPEPRHNWVEPGNGADIMSAISSGISIVGSMAGAA